MMLKDFGLWQNTARLFRGSFRRIYMAKVISLLGRGGQRFAENVLGWNRGTIREGFTELESGTPILDKYCHCGRKRTEQHLASEEYLRTLSNTNGQ